MIYINRLPLEGEGGLIDFLATGSFTRSFPDRHYLALNNIQKFERFFNQRRGAA